MDVRYLPNVIGRLGRLTHRVEVPLANHAQCNSAAEGIQQRLGRAFYNSLGYQECRGLHKYDSHDRNYRDSASNA